MSNRGPGSAPSSGAGAQVVHRGADQLAYGVRVLPEVPAAVEQVARLDGGHLVALGGVVTAGPQPGGPTSCQSAAAMLGPVALREQRGQRLGAQPRLVAHGRALAPYLLERLLGCLLPPARQLQLAAGQAEGFGQLVVLAHVRSASTTVSL